MASVHCDVCGKLNSVSKHERGKKDCWNCDNLLPEPEPVAEKPFRLPQRQTDQY